MALLTSKPKPLMLKDFLRDELSTSSSGFRTLPRTPQTTTMRSLLELELKNSQQRQRLLKSKSNKTSLSKISTIFRILPFSTFRRSFWKKLGGCQTTTEVTKPTPNKKVLIRDIVRRRSIEVVGSNSCSCSSSSGWSESCSLSSDSVASSSSPVSSSDADGDVKCQSDSTKEKQTNGEIRVVECVCQEYEEKEQLSPVSVRDFPFEDEEDDDDEVTALASTPTLPEGSSHDLIRKIQRFESLSHLVDPINLEQDFQSQLEDQNEVELEVGEDDDEIITRARELVQLLVNSGCFAGKQTGCVDEFVLLDFFVEGLSYTWRERIIGRNDPTVEKRLLGEAQDWVGGSGVVDVARGRNGEPLIREMERNGRWRCIDEEVDEVAVDVENGVLESLLEEILLDGIVV